MKKLSTLVLVAALGLAAPAFAQSPADLRNDPFLATRTTATEEAAPAPAKVAAPAAKHGKAAKGAKAAKPAKAKHAKKAKKAAAAKDAAPAKTDSK